MTVTKNYSNIYDIKDYCLNVISPKYFALDEINQLNIGLFGYTTEIMSNSNEDTFNAVSTYIREIIPNKARLPETIYSYAATSDIDITELFAAPAQMTCILLVNEADIIKYGEPNNGMSTFHLDSDMIINVEQQEFMLDYDIVINCKPYKNDYIFTANYEMSYDNELSDLKNPYIKLKRINYSNSNYLALLLNVRRANRTKITENIINNDKINLPVINVDFTNQICNFEIFYKPPGTDSYTQLKKRLVDSTPIKEPFCFFKLSDTNKLQISFTSRDLYFQPKFNSEMLIYVYTTNGAAGNFALYTGDQINTIPKSDRYDYNSKIIVYSLPQTESIKGHDSPTLDELQNLIVERNSTMGSYDTDDDLQLYFSNYKYRYNTDVLFMKKRNDIFQRLFSAFLLIKDEKTSEIMHTNTLNMTLKTDDFDMKYEQSDTSIFKPGHILKYMDGYNDYVENIDGKKITDDLSALTDDFLYVNPFLMTVSRTTGVGYYLNSIDKTIPVDYKYVNGNSIVQFICNNLIITRNALYGEDEYTLSITVSPSSNIEIPILDANKVDTGNLKIKGVFTDRGLETCYTDFAFKEYNEANNAYTFEAKIKTDDYMTLNQKFRVINVTDLSSNLHVTKTVPFKDAVMNIYAFFKYDDTKKNHKFNAIPDISSHTITNMYSTEENKIDFITPLNIIKSSMKYWDNKDGTFSINISLSPLVRAHTLQDRKQYDFFMKTIYNQHKYISASLNKIINNYSLDLKFYNTYGKAKNFIVGETEDLLNKVNCGVKFLIYPLVGIIQEDLLLNIRIYIKNFIESINNSGTNEIHISNLIHGLIANINGIDYLKFCSINGYSTDIQAIDNRIIDMNSLSKEDRKNFVPEYLNIREEDIDLVIS